MYYNRILRIWVIDAWDCFLISVIIGSLLASGLKAYLSEKAAMERLTKSLINKSRVGASKTPMLESKKSKTKRIYKFALQNRGGQLEEFKADYEFSNEVMKIAQKIQQIVEWLARVLKEGESKGLLKVFFRQGRLILELILLTCKVGINYTPLIEGLSTPVMVFTVTTGGAAGFTISWFKVGAGFAGPPLFITTLLLRSLTQQIRNQRDYLKFKNIFKKMLDEDDLKETLQAVFLEGEGLSSTEIEMGPSDLDQNSTFKYDFSGKSSEKHEEFIKEKIKEELGFVENPTEPQLKEIIKKKLTRKPKGKTVYFKDFIKEIPDSESGLDILDAEIIEERIRVRIDNEL